MNLRFALMSESSSSRDAELRWFQISIDGVAYSMADGRVSSNLWHPLVFFPPRSLICCHGCALDVQRVHVKRFSIGDPALVSACIPSSVEILYQRCFLGARALSTVTFEAGSKLSRIELLAFEYCISFSSICILSSVGILHAACFSECRALSSVTFEVASRLSHIETSVFSSCTSLSSIRIPAPVTVLGSACFLGCERLSSVTFEAGSRLSRIESLAFSRCSSLSSICLPATLLEVVETTFDDTALTDVSIPDGSVRFKIIGHLLVDFECASMMKCFGGADVIMIPRGIDKLGENCFRGNRTVSIVRFESG
jgi:hypothetical protein